MFRVFGYLQRIHLDVMIVLTVMTHTSLKFLNKVSLKLFIVIPTCWLVHSWCQSLHIDLNYLAFYELDWSEIALRPCLQAYDSSVKLSKQLGMGMDFDRLILGIRNTSRFIDSQIIVINFETVSVKK